MINPCFPLRRAFLLLYGESVFLLFVSTQSKLATLTLGAVDYIASLCLIMILYVDFIYQINMLKVEAMLKLASSFVLTSNTFDKKILP